MNNRVTAAVVELYDVTEDGPPNVGASVLAVGPGGKLCELVWTRTSHLNFYAWAPYPKMKRVTKDRMMLQYKGESDE